MACAALFALCASGIALATVLYLCIPIVETFTLLRQGVLFVHLVAFAIALSAVLQQDMALLKDWRIDPNRLTDLLTR